MDERASNRGRRGAAMTGAAYYNAPAGTPAYKAKDGSFAMATIDPETGQIVYPEGTRNPQSQIDYFTKRIEREQANAGGARIKGRSGIGRASSRRPKRSTTPARSRRKATSSNGRRSCTTCTSPAEAR
jgi:hypothetical protein